MKRTGASARSAAEKRQKHSVAAKARWADPVTGKKLRAAHGDPAHREKMRELAQARWADPAMREKMIAGMRAVGKRPKKADR